VVVSHHYHHHHHHLPFAPYVAFNWSSKV
jgi:hypothetical protein